MLEKVKLEKILFLDIETVPQTYVYEDLDEKTKELFNQKNRFAQNDEKSYEIYKSYGDTTSKGYYYHLTAGI